MSQQLFVELRDVLGEGEPQLILKNNKEGRNGAEIWRRVHRRYEVRGAQVAQAYLQKLEQFTWPTHPPGIFQMLERIERLKGE